MTKILLVEDDKSLREIYGVRLLAEGYDIVSAADGEQALAVAIKERPALIVTDVMMPRISGFDMLDILRSTTETKDIKVIVMTALSSDDHRLRGEQMGADRYLVKSQVGIEDVVRVVHEVLGDTPSKAQASAGPTLPPQTPPSPTPTPQAPSAIPPRPITTQPPAPAVPQMPPMRPVPPASAATAPQAAQIPSGTSTTGVAPHTPPVVSSSITAAPSTRQRIIQPISDPATKVDINELLDRELAKEAGVDPAQRPAVSTTNQEKALVQSQLQSFAAPQAAPPQAPAPVQPGIPTIAIDPSGHVSMPSTGQQPPATAPPTSRPVAPPSQPPVPPRQNGGSVTPPPRQNPPAAV